MIDYVKVLTTELEPAQLIIKILQEELKYIVDEPKIAEVTKDESASEWAEVWKMNHLIKQQKQTSGCVNHSVKHSFYIFPVITSYTVPVANRFASFANHHEPQENNVGISPHSSEHHLMYSSDMNYKNFKKPRRSRITYVNQQNQKINPQLNKPNLQASKENEVRTIPTVVNGVISTNNNEKSDQKYNDSIEDSINTLSQSINKLNSNSCALLNKHRVILIGDSHIRGYGCNLSALLNKNYELYSVVKPGSSSNELKDSANEEISQLSHRDSIVICSGMTMNRTGVL
jgi:hypothetical protein